MPLESIYLNGGLIGVTKTYAVSGADPGEELFTSNGSFTVPTGVTSISVVCIGAGGSGGTERTSDSTGGGGGGGGALAYSNNISVTPGEILDVVAGIGGAAQASQNQNGNPGGASSVSRGATKLVEALGGAGGVIGNGNSGAGGSAAGSTGDVKYSGGAGGLAGSSESGGGGGAAGYSGDGASGTDSDSTQTGNAGTGGSGGSGGNGDSNDPAGGGGGVGIFVEGTSGVAGVASGLAGGGGGGGSGGADGTAGSGTQAGAGGLYGGGGGGTSDDGNETSGAGANGAVRIIWGDNRGYPSTNTANGQGTSLPSTYSSGIFNLQAVLESLTQSPTLTFPWSGEVTNLGSTTRSYTSGFPLNISTAWSGSGDFTAAIDFPNGISSSDTGVILDLGGGTTGTIIVMESGTIYLGSAGHSGDTTFSTSFTPYVDQQGTLYFTVNYNVTNGEQLYWWDGSSMTELITTTMIADGAGGDNTGVGGQAGNSWNINTPNDQGTFTGTIDGYREWNGTSFDFSTV